MKILYVHGIGSNKSGSTVNWLRKYFTNHEIYSFDIPFDPVEAIKFIKEKCNELDINLIVGTSLGGFYTMCIHGVQKILVNPAIKAFETAENVIGIGTHEYLKTRDDGINTYTIDNEFIAKLKALYDKHIKNFDEEIKAETYAIFGTEDDVCNFRKEFKDMYGTKHYIEAKFGHRMTEEVFTNEFTELFNTMKNDFDNRKW